MARIVAQYVERALGDSPTTFAGILFVRRVRDADDALRVVRMCDERLEIFGGKLQHELEARAAVCFPHPSSQALRVANAADGPIDARRLWNRRGRYRHAARRRSPGDTLRERGNSERGVRAERAGDDRAVAHIESVVRRVGEPRIEDLTVSVRHSVGSVVCETTADRKSVV